jgi:hypothetical protein
MTRQQFESACEDITQNYVVTQNSVCERLVYQEPVQSLIPASEITNLQKEYSVSRNPAASSSSSNSMSENS